MKQFKHFAFWFLTLALFTIASCKDCKKKECTNGECKNDICVCNEPYEGDNCDVLWRDKFIGTYTSQTYICDSGIKGSYSSTVSANGTAGTGLEISNMANLGFPVEATVDEEDHIAIATQNLGNYVLFGDGEMTTSLDTIWLHLNLTDSAGSDSCEIILLRD